MTHTFKIRDGMQWSDGTPATSEDARWTYQLVLDAVASRTATWARLPRAVPDYAGLDRERAGCETLVVDDRVPADLLTPAYVPILPKHIWEGHTLDEIANAEADDFFPNDRPSSGPGRTRRSSGSPASSSGSPATRTTGASRARRTR